MTVKGSKLTSMRITPHNPSARVMRILALVVGFAVCVAASYFAGFYQINQQLVSQANHLDAQQQQVANRLSQDLMQLRTSAEIDRQTIEDLRQLMMAQKNQLSASERDLRIYKDLLSPNVKTNPLGLSFGVFSVLPLKDAGRFSYSLTLQKLSTKDADFSGFLEFRIIGQQGGKSLQLSLYQVSPQVTVPSIPVSFKYFHTVEGDLILPVDFVPQSVELVLKHDDKKSLPVVGVELDWPAPSIPSQ